MSCSSCLSPIALYVDQSQGDVICTSCGVVHDSHLLDSRAEWREYKSSDDIAKNLPNAIRCGMVPSDDERYIGGMQPTTLSKYVYRGCYGHDISSSTMRKEKILRKKLVKTHRVIENFIEKDFSRVIEESQLRKKQRKNICSANHIDLTELDNDTYDVIEERDEAMNLKLSLSLRSETYSMERALLLYGTRDEILLQVHSAPNSFTRDFDLERDIIWRKIDKYQKKVSHDVYVATRMVLRASEKLHLLETAVPDEAVGLLCRFATLTDGFRVKSISSRYKISSSNTIEMKSQVKDSSEQHRKKNMLQQMSALGAACLVFNCKNFMIGRSILEICESFKWDYTYTKTAKSIIGVSLVHVKPKHCVKAMAEIKKFLPQGIQSDMTYNDIKATLSSTKTINTPSSTSTLQSIPRLSDSFSNSTQDDVITVDLVLHTLRLLDLPPTTQRAVTYLVLLWKKKYFSCGSCGIKKNRTKCSPIIVSIGYMVCMAGGIMQRLSKKALLNQEENFNSTQYLSLHNDIYKYPCNLKEMRKKINQTSFIDVNFKEHNSLKNEPNKLSEIELDEPLLFPIITPSTSVDNISTVAKNSSILTDMRQVWYEWSKQDSWFRDIEQFQQYCGIPQHLIYDFYKNHIFSKRRALLKELEISARLNADIKSYRLLMERIGIVSSLMTLKGIK